MNKSSIVLTALLLMGLISLGCNGGPPIPKSFPVQGEVTLDGKPMPSGEVIFVSVAEGIRDTVKVADGKFSGEVLAGDRKVEIRSYIAKAGNTKMYGADAEPSYVNIIPKKYNEETELTATVKESDDNSFSFQVTSN
ncbi:hypothetical protein C5Y96_22325 [Blastopirellula marina]|uniref:Carboxypeptidase regulatory-like domain-containing protein n=1 Tax=Blastopirellula marina TaxID=124 RepID=A0A2S8F206_9BACT|nr:MULTISPECIES: hypothetical protein [Pirellulaceae]PQO26179.1 hypothetical protein C5Y96_22325 [Blastopirellula marina]RCS44538.1 hypothetical protein DTL36_22375 [Bremerella cremea]